MPLNSLAKIAEEEKSYFVMSQTAAAAAAAGTFDLNCLYKEACQSIFTSSSSSAADYRKYFQPEIGPHSLLILLSNRLLLLATVFFHFALDQLRHLD